MTLRERESLNPLGKPLPPKLAHRAHPEITVVQGNHKVEGARARASGWTTARSRSSTSRCAPTPSSRTRSSRAVARTRATASCRSAPAAPGDACTRPGSRAGCATTTTSSVVAEAGRDDLVEDTRLRDFLRDAARRGVAAKSYGLVRPALRAASSAPARAGHLERAGARTASGGACPGCGRASPAGGRSWRAARRVALRAWSQAEHREALRAGHQPHRVELHLRPARARAATPDRSSTRTSAAAGRPRPDRGSAAGASRAARRGRARPSRIPSSTAASSQISSA